MELPLFNLLFNSDVTPAARRADPKSAHMAAESVRPHVVKDCREVLAVHYRYRETGLDDFELGDVMGRKQTSVGVRRGNLTRLAPPLIEAVGEPRHSTSALTKRRVQCWRITRAGIEEHEAYLRERAKR